MPRRASTYHDTEKANSGELDNSGGSAAVPKQRQSTLRLPRRRLLDGVKPRATQVDGLCDALIRAWQAQSPGPEGRADDRRYVS